MQTIVLFVTKVILIDEQVLRIQMVSPFMV